MKRTDYISWDELFMATAQLAAQRSKDPSTQVGACLVDENNRIVSFGYNGFPNGCSDDFLPWDRVAEDPLDTKYFYVCHAEVNCILNSTKSDLSGCKMYVSLFPCNECAKVIIQSGVRELYYLSDKYHDENFSIAARKMFDLSGVQYKKLSFSRQKIEIDFGQN